MGGGPGGSPPWLRARPEPGHRGQRRSVRVDPHCCVGLRACGILHECDSSATLVTPPTPRGEVTAQQPRAGRQAPASLCPPFTPPEMRGAIPKCWASHVRHRRKHRPHLGPVSIHGGGRRWSSHRVQSWLSARGQRACCTASESCSRPSVSDMGLGRMLTARGRSPCLSNSEGVGSVTTPTGLAAHQHSAGCPHTPLHPEMSLACPRSYGLSTGVLGTWGGTPAHCRIWLLLKPWEAMESLGKICAGAFLKKDYFWEQL